MVSQFSHESFLFSLVSPMNASFVCILTASVGRRESVSF